MKVQIDNKSSMYINIVKGFAIFLMIWGHCIQLCYTHTTLDFFDNFVEKAIYSFHMPLFMLVSGYLFYFSFAKRPLTELILHRSKPLLHTIVFCGIFLYYISYGVTAIATKNFKALYNGEWLSSLTSMWFLWSVLVASMIVTIVCKKVSKTWIQILLLIAFSSVVLLFPHAEKNLFMYPYFVIGFYFSKYKNSIPKAILYLKYTSPVLFPIMLCFYEKKHYIYTTGMFSGNCTIGQQLSIDAFRYIIGLVGSVCALTLLELIFNFITVKVKHPIIGSCLAESGRYSLQIYAFSTALLSFYLPLVFSKFIDIIGGTNIFLNNMIIYNFVFTPILSVAYTFVIYFAVKLIYKTKLGALLFGR